MAAYTKIMAKYRLRIERFKRGYTLETFGEKIGYSAAGYGKAEARKNGISARGVERILAILEDLDFDDLFELEGKVEE